MIYPIWGYLHKRTICDSTSDEQMLFVFSLYLQFETSAKKIKGVQRGVSPLLWVSNRGEQHPCWHTIFRRKV